jgi:RimJ/RimL family protein N-acetyltransferase
MAVQDADSAQAFGRGVLVGEQVRLRPLEERDLDVLERWWGDPEWQVFQQQTVRPQPSGPSRDLFRRWSTNESGSDVGFSIETVEDGTLVGHLTLWGATLPSRAATLGILIGSEHVGRGLGTDAVRLAARYGFRVMGLHRIGLTVAAFNGRGRRAYEKAGFEVEGVRRDAVFLDGRFTDEVQMGLLEQDWAALEAAEVRS